MNVTSPCKEVVLSNKNSKPLILTTVWMGFIYIMAGAKPDSKVYTLGIVIERIFQKSKTVGTGSRAVAARARDREGLATKDSREFGTPAELPYRWSRWGLHNCMHLSTLADMTTKKGNLIVCKLFLKIKWK